MAVDTVVSEEVLICSTIRLGQKFSIYADLNNFVCGALHGREKDKKGKFFISADFPLYHHPSSYAPTRAHSVFFWFPARVGRCVKALCRCRLLPVVGDDTDDEVSQ
jgi:hypothetical protein